MFDDERKAATRKVESRIRRALGVRLFGVLILLSVIVSSFGFLKEPAVAAYGYVSAWWNSDLVAAKEIVERHLNERFISSLDSTMNMNWLVEKTQRAAISEDFCKISIDQKMTHERSSFDPPFHRKDEQVWHYEFSLGSLTKIEIGKGVYINLPIPPERTNFEETKNAETIALHFSKREAAKVSLVSTTDGFRPQDDYGQIVVFPILARNGDEEFKKSLIALDKHCGNEQTPIVVPLQIENGYLPPKLPPPS